MAYRLTRRAALAGMLIIAGAATDACARPAWLHRPRPTLPHFGNPFARPKGARMASPPVPVQTVKFPSSATTTVSGSITPTAGNDLYVALVYRNSGSGSLAEAVTDNHSQSYTRILRKFDPSLVLGVELWYAKSVVGSATTITATSGFTGTSVYTDAAVVEVSGVDPTTPNPQTASSNGNSASPDSGSATNTNANSLCFALAGNLDTSASATFTPPAGWTEQAFDRTNSEMPWSLITKQVTASAAQDATWTAGVSTDWGGLLVIAQSVVPTPVVVPVTDANWFWSRQNWYKSGSTFAESNTQGAYTKVAFTTPSGGAGQCTLTVDTTPMGAAAIPAGNYPSIAYSLDGGAITIVQLAGNSATTTPINLTGLAAGTHTLHVWHYADNSVGADDLWTTPAVVVRITNLTIDSGGATVALSGTNVPVQAKECAIFGDSITEGYNSGAWALGAFGYGLATALGAEASIIGFGGQGYTKTGNAGSNVPTFHTPSVAASQSWQWYYAAQSRLSAGKFASMPDYIVLAQGRNDNGATDASVTANVADCLTQMRAACAATTWLFVTAPVGNYKHSAILAGYNQYQAATPDARCRYIDLTTTFGISELQAALSSGSASVYSTDGIHPNQAAQGQIAALLAAAIREILDGPKRVGLAGGING